MAKKQQTVLDGGATEAPPIENQGPGLYRCDTPCWSGAGGKFFEKNEVARLNGDEPWAMHFTKVAAGMSDLTDSTKLDLILQQMVAIQKENAVLKQKLIDNGLMDDAPDAPGADTTKEEKTE